MRNRFLLFIIAFLWTQYISAQVKGVIVDSANLKPVENAVIGLSLETNKADTIYTITNEKGEFVFTKAPSANFTIIISNVGYRTTGKLRRIYGAATKIDMGRILIVNVSKIMDEIVIQTAPISIKQDTIEYRADAFKVKENSVVEDLLKKLPGVQVDKDGNIKAQGKPVTKVKVNGKDFFGGDPKTATKELPANIVDKVQIIDDYGDQAAVSGIKDQDPEKVMNIQLKKDKNTGYFGRLTAGAGTNERYQASVNGNYFKDKQQISVFSNSNNTGQSTFNSGGGNRGGSGGRSGQEISSGSPGSGELQLAQGLSGNNDGITTTNSIGFNYRDEWSKRITVYGSYTYSNRNNSGFRISSQQNIFPTGIILNNQDNNFETIGKSHRFAFNVEYNIDSFNYVKISPNFSITGNDGNNRSLFDFYSGNTKTSNGYNNTITNSNTPNFNTAILFNHRFRKRGRNFSMNLNAGNSENTSTQDSRNNTVKYVQGINSTNLFLYNMQENENRNYGVRFTYSEPLSKVRFLDLAYSHNFSYSNNNRLVYDVDPFTGLRTFNPGLSNEYENNFFNNRVNVSVRTTEKKYNYTLGISAQPIQMSGLSVTKDSAYSEIKRVNLFPVARFSYNFSKTKSLSANYRGDAQQPGFTQLQDVLDSSNRQYQTRGNPNLKPSKNQSLNLFYNDFNFTTGRVLFTSVSFNTIQNQIVQNTIRLDTLGAQLTTPQNVNGYYTVNGFYNYAKPFNNRKFIVSLNGVLNFNNNVNFIDNVKSIGKNWIITQGLNFEVNHKDWLEFAIGGNYNLNIIRYENAGSNTNFQNDRYNSWTINSNLNIDIPKNIILRYDFDYTINNGLFGGVSRNIALLTAGIEKQVFAKKTGIIRLQGFDLLNQNSNITRSVSATSIIDSRSNRLNRYFMLSFTYRLQKFAGKQNSQKANSNMIRISQ